MRALPLFGIPRTTNVALRPIRLAPHWLAKVAPFLWSAIFVPGHSRFLAVTITRLIRTTFIYPAEFTFQSATLINALAFAASNSISRRADVPRILLTTAVQNSNVFPPSLLRPFDRRTCCDRPHSDPVGKRPRTMDPVRGFCTRWIASINGTRLHRRPTRTVAIAPHIAQRRPRSGLRISVGSAGVKFSGSDPVGRTSSLMTSDLRCPRRPTNA
jgi:hypothetical protein